MRNLGDKPTDLRRIDAVTGLARVWSLILEHAESPFDVFCQIYTCLQVVNSPSSTPFSLSTLHLVTSTVSSLNNQLSSLGRSIEGISDDVLSIRRYYATVDMPNRIPDGLIPFPENEFDLSNGISVEFKNVSFKYPEGTGKNVINNLSFKIEQGQLCVRLICGPILHSSLTSFPRTTGDRWREWLWKEHHSHSSYQDLRHFRGTNSSQWTRR